MQRNIVVMANVAGRDLIGVVDDIRDLIDTDVEIPPGYCVEYGGQFESAASAGTRLLLLGVVVVVGIFLLLVAAFGSARNAFLVMLNLPLALIGGVAGVWMGNGTLTIAAIIGFITRFGIATRNGVILVDHVVRPIREEELSPLEAVHRGSEERLVPLALSGGEPGSEIQAPMAVVILWGLLSSTMLNMLVVPVMYLRYGEGVSR